MNASEYIVYTYIGMFFDWHVDFFRLRNNRTFGIGENKGLFRATVDLEEGRPHFADF